MAEITPSSCSPDPSRASRESLRRPTLTRSYRRLGVKQALKMAILHRKNSLSYKTVHGARTGDLFMSLIHTCRLNRVNPFAYLLAIATHANEVKAHPSAWLPWNYPHSEIPAELGHDPPGCPA